MTSPSGAAIRITIRDDSGLVFEFETADRASSLSVETDVSRSVFIAKRKVLLDDITRIRKSLYATDEIACGRAIHTLYKLGTTFLNEVFQDPWEIREFCAAACPPRWDDTMSPPHIVMHAMMYEMLPLEVLPLLSLEPPRSLIRTPIELAEAVHCFAGLGASVQRVIRRINAPGSGALPHDDKLNVKMFQFGSLVGVEEIKNFLTRHDRVRLESPWPTPTTQRKEFTERLFCHLTAPDKSFSGNSHDPPDAIHHFACHCDTGASNDKEHHFRLAATGSSSEFKITLGELYACRQPTKMTLPLVFMNACESAGSGASGIASFPRFFLFNGNLGFIGTEIPVLDSFAAEFARTFYSEFLGGKRLGDAIHCARWRSLMKPKSHCLIGLMYTVYADPDLSVFSDQAKST